MAGKARLTGVAPAVKSKPAPPLPVKAKVGKSATSQHSVKPPKKSK